MPQTRVILYLPEEEDPDEEGMHFDYLGAIAGAGDFLADRILTKEELAARLTSVSMLYDIAVLQVHHRDDNFRELSKWLIEQGVKTPLMAAVYGGSIFENVPSNKNNREIFYMLAKAVSR